MNEPMNKEFFVQDLVAKATEIAEGLDVYLKTIEDQYTDKDILEFVRKYYLKPDIMRIPDWSIIYKWNEILLRVEWCGKWGGESDIDTIEIKYLVNPKELDKLIKEYEEAKNKREKEILDRQEKQEREQLAKLKEKYES